MIRQAFLFSALFLLLSGNCFAQTKDILKKKIEQATAGKNVVVGIAISDQTGQDTMSIRGQERFPMQSVFKVPIALAMLSKIDQGNYRIDQEVDIHKNELLPGLWSPIRERYPEGTRMPLSEIMEYTVGLSDNAGCDLLLKLLGGPEAVEAYMREMGFEEIAIQINEETMQNHWELQFLNNASPNEINRLLRTYYENKEEVLSNESHRFLWQTMLATKTGARQLKGLLPQGTPVAHKTGNSGQNKATGVTAALNDVGVVFLPNGDHFYISVFITDSKENLETNERIIAEIAKAAWDYFLAKNP